MNSARSNSRQNLLIVLCWAVYTVAYLGRYSYNSNINLIMSDYGVDHTSAGLVTTFFFFGYGAGQFINGMLCEKYNKRWLFPLVLLVSSIINLSLYLKVPFVLVKFLWLANAFLQSCLWSSIILMVSRYLDARHLKTALMLLSTPAALGTFLSYLASTLFVQMGHFRLSFLLGTLAMSVLAVLWLVLFPLIGDLPQQTANTTKSAEKEAAEKTRPAMVVATFVGVLCVFAVIHNFIKDGLQTWVPSILKESQGLSDSLSILLSVLLPLLGIFGTVLSLTVEKRVRNLVLLCSGAFAIAVPLVWLITRVMATSTVVTLLAFGVVVLLMHTINNVVTGIAPLRMRTKTNSGRLAGILNACCYVGSTISSYLLGLLADAYGWDMVMYVFLAAAVVAVIIGVTFILVQRKKVRGGCS